MHFRLWILDEDFGYWIVDSGVDSWIWISKAREPKSTIKKGPWWVRALDQQQRESV